MAGVFSAEGSRSKARRQRTCLISICAGVRRATASARPRAWFWMPVRLSETTQMARGALTPLPPRPGEGGRAATGRGGPGDTNAALEWPSRPHPASPAAQPPSPGRGGRGFVLLPLDLEDLIGLHAAGRVDLDHVADLLGDQGAGDRGGDGDLAQLHVGL